MGIILINNYPPTSVGFSIINSDSIDEEVRERIEIKNII